MSPRKKILLFAALFFVVLLIFRGPGLANRRQSTSQLTAGIAVVIIGIAGLRGAKGKRPF